MMEFLSRSTQLEIMDDMTIQDERIDDALRELNVINKWLGGRSTTRKGIGIVWGRNDRSKSLSILDAGAGGADVATALRKELPGVAITALDLNKRVCESIAGTDPLLTVVQGSVFDLPFHERSFDIVHASLFLHHFTDAELQHILPALYARARIGVVINDLRRSVFALLGIRVLTRLFSHSPMVQHDGPLSVKRGFTRRELVRLCETLPSASYTIRRTWAFRWLVCVRRTA